MVPALYGTKYVRAWPGGTGDAKVGGNYGPTIQAQVGAQEKGCQQVLWYVGTGCVGCVEYSYVGIKF